MSEPTHSIARNSGVYYWGMTKSSYYDISTSVVQNPSRELSNDLSQDPSDSVNFILMTGVQPPLVNTEVLL